MQIKIWKRIISALSAGAMTFAVAAGTIPVAYAVDDDTDGTYTHTLTAKDSDDSAVCTIQNVSTGDNTASIASFEIYVYQFEEYDEITETSTATGSSTYVNLATSDSFDFKYDETAAGDISITPQNGYALMGIEYTTYQAADDYSEESARWEGNTGTGTFVAAKVAADTTVKLYFAKPYTIEFVVWGSNSRLDTDDSTPMSTYINETFDDVVMYPTGTTVNVTGVSDETGAENAEAAFETFSPNRTLTLPYATVKDEKAEEGYIIKNDTWYSEYFSGSIGTFGTSINLDSSANSTIDNMFNGAAYYGENVVDLMISVLKYHTVKWYNKGELIETDTVADGTKPSTTTIKNKITASGDYMDSSGVSHAFLGWMDMDTGDVYETYGMMPSITKDTSYIAVYEDTYTVKWYIRGELVETDTPVAAGDAPSFDGGDAYVYGESSTQIDTSIDYYDEETDSDYRFIKWSTDINDTTRVDTFDGTTSYLGTVEGDTTYYAVYNVDARPYEIRWVIKAEDAGTTTDKKIASKYVLKDGTAEINVNDYNISKEDGDGFQYEFVGFTPTSNGTVNDVVTEYKTENMDYDETNPHITKFYALFKEVIDVNWVVGNNTTTTTIDRGTAPTAPATPPDYSDDDNTYTFVGWSTDKDATSGITSGFSSLSSNTTYYAIYSSSSIPKYSVTFMNNDGSETLSSISGLQTGDAVTYSSDLPTKESTHDGYYTFIGWATSPNAKTADYAVVNGKQSTAFPAMENSDVTYYAVFSYTAYPQYTVTWMNGSDQIQVDSGLLSGETSTFDSDKIPSLPEDADTDKYVYTFEGWSINPNATSGEKDTSKLGTVTDDDITYYAVFSKKVICTVNFYNGSTLVYTCKVIEGNKAEYAGETLTLPEKDCDTRLYSYTFIGWDTDKNADTVYSLQNLTEDINYYAVFSVTDTPSYTITWYNGTTIADTTTDAKIGDSFSYNGETPSNYSDDNYNYTFLGWSLNKNSVSGTMNLSELGTISGDTKVYAIFNKTKIDKYAVYFVNSNGSTIAILNNLKDGAAVTYNGDTPTKASTEDYKYTFLGWDTDKNATTPTYTGLNPTFPNISNSNVTYYAIYQETLIPTYTVSWYAGIFAIYQEVKEGDYALYPYDERGTPFMQDGLIAGEPEKEYYYKFIGWSNTDPATNCEMDTTKFGPITKNTIFYAVFETVYYKKYTITWKYGNTVLEVDKDVLETKVPEFNGTVPSLPENADTERYTYTFSGWSTDPNAKVGIAAEDLGKASADTVYYAIYTKKSLYGTAIVSFKNGDEVIQKEVDIDTPFDFTIDDPDEPSDADSAYDYEFKGWSTNPNATNGTAFKDLPLTEDDTVYYAIFKATPKRPTALSNDVDFIVQCRRNSDSHTALRMNPIEGTYEIGEVKENNGEFTVTAKLTKMQDYCTAFGRLYKWEHKNPYAERYQITLTWNDKEKEWQTNDSFLIKVECVDAPAKATSADSIVNQTVAIPNTGIKIPVIAIIFIGSAAAIGVGIFALTRKKKSQNK